MSCPLPGKLYPCTDVFGKLHPDRCPLCNIIVVEIVYNNMFSYITLSHILIMIICIAFIISSNAKSPGIVESSAVSRDRVGFYICNIRLQLRTISQITRTWCIVTKELCAHIDHRTMREGYFAERSDTVKFPLKYYNSISKH